MAIRALMAAACLAFGLTCGSGAQAQSYPDKLIKIVAPFPAGGVVDVLARSLGEELSKALGKPVIIENRPGAGGNVGADAVAKSAPDGYTLLMTSPGIQSINQFLYKTMPFDPETAFEPISLVADMPMLVVLNSKSEHKTFKSFIEAAKSEPERFNFGSAGFGTTGHLGMELLSFTAGIKLRHTPYRGAAPAVNDLLGAHIDGVVDNPPTTIHHINAGTLQALVVASDKRLPSLPNIPTSIELGLPDFRISSWFGLMAPAKTPNEIIQRLHDVVRTAVTQPAMRKFAADTGVVMVGGTPAEFDDVIKSERKKYGDLIAKAKITLN